MFNNRSFHEDTSKKCLCQVFNKAFVVNKVSTNVHFPLPCSEFAPYRKRGQTSLNVNDDTSMTRYITQRLMSYDNRKRGQTSPSVNDETSIQDQYPEHLRVLIENQRHIQ